MSRWPRTPRVDLVTTDGFLYPNAELERRGIMHRKGFPESYDRRALLDFLTQVKSGVEEVRAPMYSHVSYDILPDQWQTVLRPDVLILEGLNVLAPPRLVCEPGGSTLAVSDFFDFSIYLDANPTDVEEWYVSRYHQLRQTAFRSPNSYFREIASWPREQAEAHARQIWRDVNLVNLVENVAPTRTRATLILEKDTDHRIHQLSPGRGRFRGGVGGGVLWFPGRGRLLVLHCGGGFGGGSWRFPVLALNQIYDAVQDQTHQESSDNADTYRQEGVQVTHDFA